MRKRKNESMQDFVTRRGEKLAAVKNKKAGSFNPKKNPRARRARGKLGVYIPFVILRPRFLKDSLTGKRTIFAGYHGFNSTDKGQQKINDGLIERAKQARKNGGYHLINPQVSA